MQDLSKIWVSTRKHFEDFRRKKRTETKLSTLQKSPWNTRLLSTKVSSDSYCASYKFNSIGTKILLNTQTFEKKAIFLMKKRN